MMSNFILVVGIVIKYVVLLAVVMLISSLMVSYLHWYAKDQKRKQHRVASKREECTMNSINKKKFIEETKKEAI